MAACARPRLRAWPMARSGITWKLRAIQASASALTAVSRRRTPSQSSRPSHSPIAAMPPAALPAAPRILNEDAGAARWPLQLRQRAAAAASRARRAAVGPAGFQAQQAGPGLEPPPSLYEQLPGGDYLLLAESPYEFRASYRRPADLRDRGHLLDARKHLDADHRRLEAKQAVQIGHHAGQIEALPAVSAVAWRQSPNRRAE